MKKNGIGLDVKKPAKDCADKNCPFHGSITVRGRVLTGTVTSDKMSKTVAVGWTRKVYVPKYERYEKRRSKVKAHNPECINAKKGDLVKLVETKPLAKTKHFVVVEIIGSQSKGEVVKSELMQESLVAPASDENPIEKADRAGAEARKKSGSESEE
jgi:small subunit ribosomal protein S17